MAIDTSTEDSKKSDDGMASNNIPPFFDFNKRNFSKLAREYHHEIQHLIIDLSSTNIKIQRAAILCDKQIELRAAGKKIHLYDPDWKNYFEDVLYHLENYYFRASTFRDKLAQFVNQALKLGYDESERELIKRMSNNRIYIESRINTELKKFEQETELREVLSKRVYMSHRRYYSSDSYNPYFQPEETPSKENVKRHSKLWRKNIQTEVEKVNTFTATAIDISNKVMVKINAYIKKYHSPSKST